MDELILENKNLIYSITKYFENYSNKEDLFQVGCIGLITAFKNYDDSMNVKFTTYAYPYILGEMRKLVREDKCIRINRNLQRINLRIEKAAILLAQQLMRMPTNEEIANYLEIPVNLVFEALNVPKVTNSLDEPIKSDSKEFSLHETVSTVENMSLDDIILIRNEINKLDNRDKNLIMRRYYDDMTQQETAKDLGISQVQVSREEKKVLNLLKNRIAA